MTATTTHLFADGTTLHRRTTDTFSGWWTGCVRVPGIGNRQIIDINPFTELDECPAATVAIDGSTSMHGIIHIADDGALELKVAAIELARQHPLERRINELEARLAELERRAG